MATAQMPKVLKNFTAYVDGVGYAGRVTELEPPKIKLKTEEHRAGGMDTPVEIDLGTEKLEATATFAEYNEEMFALLGLVAGSEVGVTFRGAKGDGDSARAIIMEMRGRIAEADPGTWKPADKATHKLRFPLVYYKLTIDGKECLEIDILNMVRKVGGKDQLAAMRTALGV